MANQKSPDHDIYDKLSADQFSTVISNILHPKKRRRHKRPSAQQRALREVLHPKSWEQRYREYMDSSRWFRFRRNIIKKRGPFCERCGKSTVKLHVHHLSYARFGNESEEDVIVLCVPCHQKRHMDKKTFWK